MVDKVAEWLWHWTAIPMCSALVGSNPILVGIFSVYHLLIQTVMSDGHETSPVL